MGKRCLHFKELDDLELTSVATVIAMSTPNVVVDRVLGGELMSRTGLLVIPATALFMAVIGMIAAAGPAKRGLRIQPTEALRSD